MDSALGSLFVFGLVFIGVAVLPIKWAGKFLGAQRYDIPSVLWAMLLALPLGFIGSQFLGLGVFGSYLGFAFAILVAMRPSMLGALLIPVVAVIILFVLGQLGAHLGIIEITTDAA